MTRYLWIQVAGLLATSTIFAASPTNATPPTAAALLTIRVLGSYPYYGIDEYRYWAQKTIACFTVGVGQAPAGEPHTAHCRTIVGDPHRTEALALRSQLAQITARHAGDYEFGCGGLDTPAVEIHGTFEGAVIRLSGKDPVACNDKDSRVISRLLALTPPSNAQPNQRLERP
jgi:hypothetical protein